MHIPHARSSVCSAWSVTRLYTTPVSLVETSSQEGKGTPDRNGEENIFHIYIITRSQSIPLATSCLSERPSPYLPPIPFFLNGLKQPCRLPYSSQPTQSSYYHYVSRKLHELQQSYLPRSFLIRKILMIGRDFRLETRIILQPHQRLDIRKVRRDDGVILGALVVRPGKLRHQVSRRGRVVVLERC